jgi:hypothetical protein
MHLERRRKPRVNDPIQIAVRGLDDCGARYHFDTVTRDIGSDGLCALAPRVMKAGDSISLRILFARAGSKPLHAPAMAARGVVLRVEEQADKSSLFAVSFISRRMI